MLACWSTPMHRPACRQSSGQSMCLFQKYFMSTSPFFCSTDMTSSRKLPEVLEMSISVTGKRSVCRIKLKSPAVPVLDRYVVVELIPPMVFGIAVFSTLGVSMGIGPELSDLVGRAGVRWSTLVLAIRLVLFRAPAYVGFALPIASLLAPLLTFGRMGADGEILALRACGLSARRIVQPAILVFTAVTVLHLFLTENVIPVANRKAVLLKSGTVFLQDTVTPQLKIKNVSASSQPVIYLNYLNGNLRHMFYAHRFDGEKLLNVTLVEMQGNSVNSKLTDLNPYEERTGLRLSKVLTAESATWDANKKSWKFENGAEYVIQQTSSWKEQSETLVPDTSRKPHHQLPAIPASCALQSVCQFNARYPEGLTSAPLQLAKLQHGRNFDDMSVAEVLRLLQLLDESRNVGESRRIQVKLQQRMALPFACLVFGMVGSFISLNLPRDQKKIGLAWMLVTVFTYYVLNVCGSVLGQLNIVSPVVGGWMPNLVGLLTILVLQRKADS